jgi:hypothetical protein
MIVAAEVCHREASLEHHDWMARRKIGLEAEARQRETDAARRARELREEERERIERLLAQSGALRKAEEIRAYVAMIVARSAELPAPLSHIEFWAAWALNEADRIDPIKMESSFSRSPR